MVEIKLSNPDSFLKIRETLTRIGIACNKEKKLYQSCHILQKNNRYFIVHFKELLQLDGRVVDITTDDINRRNDITMLLCDWNLCTLLSDIKAPRHNFFRVLSYAMKSEWELIYKYKL
ncbi:MAG: translational repressor RegA [Culicoidibacterales bacterium]